MTEVGIKCVLYIWNLYQNWQAMKNNVVPEKVSCEIKSGGQEMVQ